MFRDTMMSTMPVAMMAIEVLWTERFHMLRAVRKSPPEKTLKPIQMTSTATTMPNRRVSTSAEARRRRQEVDDVVSGVLHRLHRLRLNTSLRLPVLART